jgi:tetratricopeptide (TPR) repeat protein
VLLSAVREMDAALRPALRGPFDGAQARKLLELMHRTCDAHGWTHEQLQALAEGYSTEPDLAPVFASAWSSWASLLPSSPNDVDEDAVEPPELADAWLQCQEDVEAAADALGHGRLLEARDLLTYALATWEDTPLPSPEPESEGGAGADGGGGVRLSASRAAAREYVVEAYCLRADCAALEAAADGGESEGDTTLSAAARADLQAALALDPSCSAAHFRLARAVVANSEAAEAARNVNSSSSASASSVGAIADGPTPTASSTAAAAEEVEAARVARLAKLADGPSSPAAAAVVVPTAGASSSSEGLVHAVAGVVIGSEQLPELIELCDMVESLSKEAGKQAAAALWAEKDPRGLPPAWVLASYFDSFGRWLLQPAAAEPPSEEERQAVAAGKRATVSLAVGRSEFSRVGLRISTVDAESETVCGWRERLASASAQCKAQEYDAAEAALVGLAGDVLAHAEVTARLQSSSSCSSSSSSSSGADDSGGGGSGGSSSGSTAAAAAAAAGAAGGGGEIVGRRAWGVAAASLAGRACFLYMEARYASAAELLDQVLLLEPDNPLWLCQRATVQFDMGEVDLAHKNLEAALALDRRCAPAYLQRGHIQVRKRAFVRHFILKTIILPRQARDKHRESTQKETRILTALPW